MFFVAVFKRDFIYLCGKIRKRSLRGASVGVFLWRIVSEKTTLVCSENVPGRGDSEVFAKI